MRIVLSLKWRVSTKTLAYFMDEATWAWDEYVRHTSLAGLKFREPKDATSFENSRGLQQQCDYIILFPEVNEMQKPRVVLALLYTFLSTARLT